MATYYLDSIAGSDSNNGTDSSTPWQTITKLNNTSLAPGDIVRFKRGSTFVGSINVDAGSAGNPVTYSDYGTGSLPVINANGGNYCLGAYTKDYWTVENLHLKNAFYYAVLAGDTSNYVTVRNCEISASGCGVNVQDSVGADINHNYIHDLTMVVNDATPSNDYGAIAVNFTGAHDCEVAYNQIVRCRATSQDFGYDGSAFEFWNTNYNINIHHNWVEACDCFMEAGADPGHTFHDVTFAYNVYVNGYGGLCQIHNGSSGLRFTLGLSNVLYYNNTYIPASDYVGFDIWFPYTSTATEAYFRNNIIIHNAGSDLVKSQGFTHDHNIFYGTLGTFTMGAGDLNVDPQFVNRAGGDYHLNIGSPAIGGGTNVSLTLDYDGVTVGTPPDIGAFEYVAPQNITGSRFHIWNGSAWV